MAKVKKRDVTRWEGIITHFFAIDLLDCGKPVEVTVKLREDYYEPCMQPVIERYAITMAHAEMNPSLTVCQRTDLVRRAFQEMYAHSPDYRIDEVCAVPSRFNDNNSSFYLTKNLLTCTKPESCNDDEQRATQGSTKIKTDAGSAGS